MILRNQDGDHVKAFIRNEVFYNVKDDNKKAGSLPTAKIRAVVWPMKESVVEVPVKEWLKLAEENNFWGLE